MKKTTFIIFITFITVIVGALTARPSQAHKYEPPPPVDNPPPVDVPIPPPPGDESPDQPPDSSITSVPTTPVPTPCIPNWCFRGQTECCFDPICIFLGETNKGKNDRCNTSPAANLQFLSRSPSKTLSFFGKMTLFFQSIFNPKK